MQVFQFVLTGNSSTSSSVQVADDTPSSLQGINNMYGKDHQHHCFIFIYSVLSAATMEFSYEELLRATGNRSSQSLIGSGGYGSVYSGMLRHTKVAVKFLSEVRG